MVSFENTDLKIIAWDTNNGTRAQLYILLEAGFSNSFDPYLLLEKMHDIEHDQTDEDEKDREFDDLMDLYGIIEIFEDEEINELIEENEIDPGDLHQSIYELVSREQS